MHLPKEVVVAGTHRRRGRGGAIAAHACAGAGPRASRKSEELEEVLVTARRRSETFQATCR